ncbi:MAG: Clp1/GlmU family protein [Atribacterota bacterium]
MNFFNGNLLMPGDWVPVVQKILKWNDKVMILGQSDSGKTSFMHLLAHYMLRRNRKIGLIDGDIGQSTLGPPGTINMQILEYQNLKSKSNSLEYMVFVGAKSPATCIKKFIYSISKVFQICQRHRVDIIVIDTTGLVSGELGIYLKTHLIKKIQPSTLIALQREEELEPILNAYEPGSSVQIYRLKPFCGIKRKNWQERKKRRERQYKEYFKETRLMEFNFCEIPLKGLWFSNGKLLARNKVEQLNQEYQLKIQAIKLLKNMVIIITENQSVIFEPENIKRMKNHFKLHQIVIIPQSWFKYLLISFNDSEGLSKSLGIIQKIDFWQEKLTAYLPGEIALYYIKQIELGQIKIKPNGTELPYLEPKTY